MKLIILLVCDGDKSTQEQGIVRASCVLESMKELKTQTSKSYKEYLISSLKDDKEAAAYIKTFLKLGEDGYDAQIMRSALEEVVEARKQLGNFSLPAQQHHGKLDQILAQTGGEEILTLIEFLDALGYTIALVAKDEQI